MDLKMLGIALVIIGCGAFGFRLAAHLRLEIHALRDLIDILNYMKCELNYRLTPLPQLCRLSAERGKSLRDLFLCFADEMDGQISTDTASCMEAAIYKNAGISDSIKVLLQDLGCSFGKFDLEGQLSGIDSVCQKCAKRLEELEKDKDIRTRNYQTLGLCAGAALAILLF